MISVCMATYNGEKYIKEQIDSILRCISECDELIISDDGSSDKTMQIVNSYKSVFPNVRIFEGPKRGPVRNFENALMHASGDYIFLSDQDDVWSSNKIRAVIDAFNESVDVCTIVHDATIVDSNLNQTGGTLFSLRKSGEGLVKNIIKNSYVGCCMAFKKELLDVALPIPDGVPMHDWWLGLCSEAFFRTQFIDCALIEYRRHGDNVSKLTHGNISSMIRSRAVLLLGLIQRLAKRWLI